MGNSHAKPLQITVSYMLHTQRIVDTTREETFFHFLHIKRIWAHRDKRAMDVAMPLMQMVVWLDYFGEGNQRIQ